MFVHLFCTVWVVVSLCDGVAAAGSPRHIVFIVADDLGWNDVGLHNPDMITPNIDRLAREGVILNQSYVQPLCSPSRSAFMSGYYPFKTGLQHMVILNYQPVCLPLNITILPQKLKELGYATHIVGKWHNGFCSWNCTPTYRGFDSFFGYYNAQEDYYTHTTAGFLDYRNNTSPERTENGTYSTFQFTDVAIDIIQRHDKNQPLFLYLPFQAVHAPIEVPPQYEALYPNVKTEDRRKFCGMVSALDEAVGNITKTLTDSGLMDDTLILFTADNGGWITEHGNNYPLRGGKFTVYEGGTRAVAFLHGSGLENNGTVFDGVGDYKLIDGYPGLYTGWYKPEQVTSDLNLTNIKDWATKYQLFNLKDDPTEHNDLSTSHPDIVKQLAARLAWYEKQAVPPNYPLLPDPKSNPQLYGNVWSPGWC
ncbi:arylsulfatase B-like isoform X2 [Haliotis asinina]|uniref:arylsulfatase B-like isoform X2 n=1 Tax=Haliotis asinina TaxID=109174 RepID=UPI0035324879